MLEKKLKTLYDQSITIYFWSIFVQILTVCYGTLGDVYPLLLLSQGLAQQGHDVTIISTLDLQATIQSYHLKFYPILDQDFYLKMMKFDGKGTVIKEVQHYLIEEPTPEVYRAVKNCMGTKKTLLISSLASAYATRIVADACKLPCVIIHYAPAGLLSAREPTRVDEKDTFNKIPPWSRPLMLSLMTTCLLGPTVVKAVNKLRKNYGLAPIKPNQLMTWLNEGLSSEDTIFLLGLFPDWFARPLCDEKAERVMQGLPKKLYLTHYPLVDNRQKDYQLPETVQSFLQKYPKPLVFTFGTRVGKAKQLFTLAQKACEALQRPAIFLSAFAENIPGNLPDFILHKDYLPLSEIIPKAAILVHHGGIGTASQAFAAGIPQLIRPTMGDQFDNAARVTQLGVGLELSCKQFTEENLIHALEALLNQASFQTACLAIQLKMQEAGTPAIQKSQTAIEHFIESLV